ncbi:MAG: radical SAM family heme chaperone HemW [Candidatus Hydrogenedentota bacterium]|nr:MAG: radical SAM family heme chaperone HemW [Candidatus Hydrogenedentota bacterium]
MATRILSAYIHFPFCDVKCAYCDFFSIAKRHYPTDFEDTYLNQIKQDLAKKIPLVQNGETLRTVFFGGGTPSKASGSFFSKSLALLKNSGIPIHRNLEITAEGNPESLTYEKLCQMREAGVNRISIGIQSFQENVLKYLGRLYHPKQYKEVIQFARKAGFTNISADLIYGVPSQKWQQVQDDLNRLIDEGVVHISAYALTKEAGTKLAMQMDLGQKKSISAYRQAFQQEKIEAYLIQNGFYRYEVSNYAKPGYDCMHNVAVWKGRKYIGLGVAAHSFLHNVRILNPKSLKQYAVRKFTTIPSQKEDYLIGISRLAKPQSFQSLLKFFSKEEVHRLKDTLVSFCPEFIKVNSYFFQLTPKGLLFSDSILDRLANAISEIE